MMSEIPAGISTIPGESTVSKAADNIGGKKFLSEWTDRFVRNCLAPKKKLKSARGAVSLLNCSARKFFRG